MYKTPIVDIGLEIYILASHFKIFFSYRYPKKLSIDRKSIAVFYFYYIFSTINNLDRKRKQK